LKSAGADTRAFEYVRRTREISQMAFPAMGGSSTPNPGASQGGELFKGWGVLGSRVSSQYFVIL
jgi:sec1 family domain-containing protein 1